VRVTLILPASTEATSPLFRPIKYSLFPPLGPATLAVRGRSGCSSDLAGVIRWPYGCAR